MDFMETEEVTSKPKYSTRIPHAQSPGYYSKEWRNIHHRQGYKAYDQVSKVHSR